MTNTLAYYVAEAIGINQFSEKSQDYYQVKNQLSYKKVSTYLQMFEYKKSFDEYLTKFKNN